MLCLDMVGYSLLQYDAVPINGVQLLLQHKALIGGKAGWSDAEVE